MNGAGSEIGTLGAYPDGPDPCGESIASLLRHFKLDRMLSLLLHDYRAGSGDISMAYVPRAHLTKSHDRALLSMARLKSASSRVRWPIWSLNAEVG